MRASREIGLTSLFLSLVAAGCGNGLGEKSNENPVSNLALRDIAPAAAPAGAHLTYYGGRVISNVQVVQVLYGSGSYIAQVTSTGTPTMASFYAAVTNSAYLDWLAEYDTTVAGGTNQTIGRGSFLKQVAITPAAARNGSTITDAQIQAELAAQIASGILPAPSKDAAGNVNTYYAVFFPHGKVISQGGSNSCQAGGFCSYHGTANAPQGEIYYGVHPDMQAGSGCDTGCGGSSSTFGNQTSIASHELLDAITDPEVELATTVAAPVAWFDSNFGDIAVICNNQNGTIFGADGITYVVQRGFDNATGNCIVSTAPDNFSLSASPASLSVTQGTSRSGSIFVTTTSGNPQTVSLSVSGAPAGVTASLTPTSVTSGGSSTLTVSASATAAVGTFSLTVTGTGASGTQTVTVPVTIVARCITTTQLLANPGFETTAAWTASPAVLGDGASGVHVPRTGTGFAWLDGYGTSHTDTLSQTVFIPANACSATFSFWVKIDTAEGTTTTPFDTLTVSANSTTLATSSNLNHGTTYVQRSFDLSAFKGTSVTVKFVGSEDISQQTSFLIDDTALTVVQ